MSIKAGFEALLGKNPRVKRWRLEGNTAVIWWDGQPDPDEEEGRQKGEKRRCDESDEEEGRQDGDRVGEEAMIAALKARRVDEKKKREEEEKKEEEKKEEEGDMWEDLLNF
jgi:hypothetical protein